MRGIQGWRVLEPCRVEGMAPLAMTLQLSPTEGQRLQRIVRDSEFKAGGKIVRWRRVTMMLASGIGNKVPMIARLVLWAKTSCAK